MFLAYILQIHVEILYQYIRCLNLITLCSITTYIHMSNQMNICEVPTYKRTNWQKDQNTRNTHIVTCIDWEVWHLLDFLHVPRNSISSCCLSLILLICIQLRKSKICDWNNRYYNKCPKFLILSFGVVFWNLEVLYLVEFHIFETWFTKRPSV